jgi:hypothetical protein
MSIDGILRPHFEITIRVLEERSSNEICVFRTECQGVDNGLGYTTFEVHELKGLVKAQDTPPAGQIIFPN